tara:strand:+ start:3161 stop:4060 length:900 start_codon:yes stop_codon:yes gene_type:complete
MISNVPNWDIKSLINSGSFGSVFKCFSKHDDKQIHPRAIKIENNDCKVTQILYESDIYYYIHNLNTYINQHLQNKIQKYFLFYYDSGSTKSLKYLVLDFGGHDLSHITSRDPSLLASLFIQMIDALHTYHTCGFLHRDIKPQNYLIKEGTVKLIDLGLSKRYLDDSNHHISCVKKHSVVGTLRYNSIFCMNYVQSSRRDDVISLVYSIINISHGKLPWESKLPHHISKQKHDCSEKAFKKLRHNHILTIKRITSPIRLVKSVLEPLQKPLKNIIASAQNLKFTETPPYKKYINQFKMNQ